MTSEHTTGSTQRLADSVGNHDPQFDYNGRTDFSKNAGNSIDSVILLFYVSPEVNVSRRILPAGLTSASDSPATARILLDNGKPVERRRRKAMGLPRSNIDRHGCQVSEGRDELSFL